MRTFRIVEKNDRFELGGLTYFLPHGEEVTAEEIVDDLNRQAGPFLRFYVGAGESVRYSFVNDETKVLRGAVEL